MTKYLVTCLNCKGKDYIAIDKADQIFWNNNKSIVSGRKRLDGTWGFQCLCGNNTIMTKQETEVIDNPQAPDPKQVATIVNNPIRDEADSFRMEKE